MAGETQSDGSATASFLDAIASGAVDLDRLLALDVKEVIGPVAEFVGIKSDLELHPEFVDASSPAAPNRELLRRAVAVRAVVTAVREMDCMVNGANVNFVPLHVQPVVAAAPSDVDSFLARDLAEYYGTVSVAHKGSLSRSWLLSGAERRRLLDVAKCIRGGSLEPESVRPEVARMVCAGLKRADLLDESEEFWVPSPEPPEPTLARAARDAVLAAPAPSIAKPVKAASKAQQFQAAKAVQTHPGVPKLPGIADLSFLEHPEQSPMQKLHSFQL